MMSSTTSQNLPRTFVKLASTWDKKAGKRTAGQGIWSSGNPEMSRKFPVQYIPCVLSMLFERTRTESISECMGKIHTTETVVQGNQIWIYSSRNSDSLPRTIQDEQKLYAFVKTLISSWCERDTYLYMEKNIHICVCFFVWYFTKPNFFFIDKVIKQTTRNGIQRIWTPLLLGKKPKEIVNSSGGGVKIIIPITSDAMLPKQQQNQEKLCGDIENIVLIVTGKSVDWGDATLAHMQISECLNSGSSHMSTKQNKKLLKLYNDYNTITNKIKKTLEKIRKGESAKSKQAGSQAIAEAWVPELGTPPSSPQLLRGTFSDGLGMAEEITRTSECCGCETNQPNQLAHMDIGGCLSDFDDVPESWEDL